MDGVVADPHRFGDFLVEKTFGQMIQNLFFRAVSDFQIRARNYRLLK